MKVYELIRQLEGMPRYANVRLPNETEPVTGIRYIDQKHITVLCEDYKDYMES